VRKRRDLYMNLPIRGVNARRRRGLAGGGEE